MLIALVMPFIALSLTPNTAIAASSDLAHTSRLLADLPENQLKDDDDEDDDNDEEDDEIEYEYEYEERRESTRTTTTTTVTQVSYRDVSTSYWASGFIYRLAALNVVSGYPDGEFLPATYLTKSHYAAMMTKAFNKRAVREVVNIRNVSQYYWAYSALQEAYAEGFIDLTADNTFDPEANMTKLEMWVMLARALGYTEITSDKTVEELLSVFTDADRIPTEYRIIIAALVERGIIVSYPTTTELNLFDLVTRAEACSYIYQAMVSVNLAEAFYSAYIVDVFGIYDDLETTTVETTTTTESTTIITDEDDEDDEDDDDNRRRNCNQGIGNGAEGCDPGNSRPHGGSNDEGGRTPGNR